ncbi:MAG TPA: hypothetical protein VKU19_36730 [Bryobacteraceae bacterium]|nr:hypothetical protein [Bryobacteraceae bacterium]
MSTQTIALSPPRSANWIISGREDLTWFIGSSVASYVVLALMAAGFPVTPLYLVWLFGIDGPHVLATATRTYFDNNERQRLGSLLWVVVPAMLVGPVMVAAGAGPLFYVLATSWLHFHIAKQHFGFVMLYRHKNRERSDFLLDRWFLLVSLMLPYARLIIKGNTNLFALSWVRTFDSLLLTIYALGALAFVARQLQKVMTGEPLNSPKLMLFAVVVPLQWLAFGYAATTGTDGLIRAGIVLGLFHSFQYHRLMWFHNQNHYADPKFGESAGLAATLARRFVYYFGAALALNLLLNLGAGSLPVFASYPALKAAPWGVAFTHYILDSKIWRVRGNKDLAAALRMA